MSPMVIAGLMVFLGFAAALPTDPIIKLDPEIRYALMPGPDGKVHQVDLWLTADDLRQAARYDPAIHNVYHFFSRQNPTISIPVLVGYESLLPPNLDISKPFVIMLHGWLDTADGDINSALVSAYLDAHDVNIIVVDWNEGGGVPNYATAVINTATSGRAVGEFINWLNGVSGNYAENYHVMGLSLGGQQSGIVGRHVLGNVKYITGLDPALPGWVTNENRFHQDDGSYTEIIHSNSGVLGYMTPLGHVDYYPNGGRNMPGCGVDITCSHIRCAYYFAESLVTGGFTGRRCSSYLTALAGNCDSSDTLQMGGSTPKTGSTGVYYMETNAAPPFSMG